MKTQYFIIIICLFTSKLHAQNQIENSNFEQWENVGASNEEPTNWNSFKSASGTWSSFSAQQLKQSSEVRPGSTGTFSAQLWTRDATLAIANGNMTIGQINMGSTTPNNEANYNFTNTSDPSFSESLTQLPDSIVFWVKFSPINSAHEARITSIIHDQIDFKDPNDVGNSTTVATAIENFPSTNGNWVRKSLPFSYTSNLNAQYILVTFATNKTPGVGTDGGTESTRDNLWIDDLSLIYNPTSSIQKNNSIAIAINYKNDILSINEKLTGTFSIVDYNGKVLFENQTIQKEQNIKLTAGVYFVQLYSNEGILTKKLIVD